MRQTRSSALISDHSSTKKPKTALTLVFHYVISECALLIKLTLQSFPVQHNTPQGSWLSNDEVNKSVGKFIFHVHFY